MDLVKFRKAQAQCYSQVIKELKNGKKKTHWIWFIFPQIMGLGKSITAKEYEIKSAHEAYRYLVDPLLSYRLRRAVSILAYDVKGKTAEEIFGFPDYLKFHSSLTLFYLIVNQHLILKTNAEYVCFEDALIKYYNGINDNATVLILNELNQEITDWKIFE